MNELPLQQLAIAGYRSIRSMILDLGPLNVITGPNGSGKSNLYRAMRLMASVAEGQLLASLATEGGFRSTLWAGPEKISREMRSGQVPAQGAGKRIQPIALKLGFTGFPLSYTIEMGLPQPSGSIFITDPEIKRECVWVGPALESRQLCADRRRGSMRVRRGTNPWRDLEMMLPLHASMLTEYSDPFAAPELIVLRDSLRSWRFYDSFRVDALSPARQVITGTMTPVMAADGRDFVAALQTIREIGDSEGLDAAISDAFPGSSVQVALVGEGLRLEMLQPAMLRELTAAELSDGTLRYLLLVTALLTPRPPGLMVLNEPESSLHPDLLPALGRLILRASERSQMIVVTHSQQLVECLDEHPDCRAIRLIRDFGETVEVEQNLLNQYQWQWPRR